MSKRKSQSSTQQSFLTEEEQHTLHDLLKKVTSNPESSFPLDFEFDAFQIECWARLLKGRDLLVCLRTGGGKFLIAALAILFCNMGVCCMLVPLDMLILEHEESLQKLGVPEDRIFILNTSNMNEVTDQVLATKRGDDPLFVLGHPERFVTFFRQRTLLRCSSISLLVADEVQLVEEWGVGGFREAWKLIATMRQHHDKLRFAGFSGSLNGAACREICAIVGIDESSISVGTMSRPRTKLEIVDGTGLHPRTVDDWPSGSAKSYQMHRILKRLQEDDRGVLIWVESIKGCEKFCTELNDFFKSQHANITAHTYYSDDSTFSQKAVLQMYGDPNNTCRAMVGTIAFMFGLNVPPTSAVVALGCPASLSQYWQLLGRANRTRDELLKALGLLFLDYKKYKLDVSRAREKLSFVYEGKEGVQEAAARNVSLVQEIYKFALDARLCLRLFLEQYFEGSQEHTDCERGGAACCGNCERKWKIEDARGAATTDVEVKKTINRYVTTKTPKEFVERKVSTFPKPRLVKWKNASGNVKTIGSVLPTNVDISTFLQKTLIHIFRQPTSTSGIARAKLAKLVAAKTGKKGLKGKEVEWCLWWYMTNGYLKDYQAVGYEPGNTNTKQTTVSSMFESSGEDEECEEDGGGGGGGGETKEQTTTIKEAKKSWRVLIEVEGFCTHVWAAPPLNERLGNFGIESDYFVQDL